MKIFKEEVHTRSCAKINQEFLPQMEPEVPSRTITNNHLDVGQQVRGIRVVRGLFFLLILSILFISCDEPKDSGNLNGTWSSAYDSYKINTSTNKIEYVGNYKADIVNSPNYEAGSGILIIKFTWYYETIYNNETWEIESEGETDKYNNKYGAVYWKELTVNSIKMGDAWNSGIHAMYDTINEAHTNFTIDKTGNFISMWGSYTK